MQDTLTTNATDSYSRILSGIASNLDSATRTMITAAKYISFDLNVLELLKHNNGNDYFNVEDSYEIEKKLVNLQIHYLDYYFQMNIITNDGQIISNALDNATVDFLTHRDSAWRDEALASPGVNVWVTPHTAPASPYDFSTVAGQQIMIASAVANYQENTVYGMITVGMPRDQFQKKIFTLTGNTDTSGELVLGFDDKGYCIFSSNDEVCRATFEGASFPTEKLIQGSGFSLVIGGTRYLVNRSTVKHLGWTLVQLVPYSEINAGVINLMKGLFLIQIVIFLVMILSVINISRKITSPISRLVSQMEKVQQGDLLARVCPTNDSSYEIGVLENNFNTMVVKQRELIDRVTSEERRIQEKERHESEPKMEMLMAQINPHFLFNTLNMIKFSALMSGAPNVATMLSNLGYVLEMSINRDGDIITLDNELKIVDSYFYIQRVRLSSRIELITAVDAGLGGCHMPKFTLQPLVENSILHAFSEQDEGTITITAHAVGNRLILEVIDDGGGMRQDALSSLAKAPEKGPRSTFSGIGVHNVDERVKLHYGQKYGLSFRSEIGVGTTVAITLPLIR